MGAPAACDSAVAPLHNRPIAAEADLQARAIQRLYWVESCRGGNQNAYVRGISCPMSGNDHIAEVEGQISSGSLAELLPAKGLTRSVRSARMGAPYSQYPF